MGTGVGLGCLWKNGAWPGQVDTRAWDQCGLDLEAIGIRRDTMMTPGEVADAIWFAVGRDGQAAPEEILLTPRCGA